ncbi:MAG: hypothetical protein IT459_13045 [Planctomycetes bacterium]|nr:hypothetical protein [Planctomycetota bacterium]
MSVQLDVGRAYMKVAHAECHPHGLAAEYIGTRLAHEFGLRTFDFGLIELSESDASSLAPEIRCDAGPAFVTRTLSRLEWNGKGRLLQRVPAGVLARLVVFDTWLRNDDRYPPVDAIGALQSSWPPNRDNVFLTEDGALDGALELIAMDFGRAMIGGREFTSRLSHVDCIKDPWVYGLYPVFLPFTTPGLVQTALADLGRVRPESIQEVVAAVPGAWQVGVRERETIVRHLVDRAHFLVDNVPRMLPRCEVQRGLYGEGGPHHD